jgi:hypothetical protein
VSGNAIFGAMGTHSIAEAKNRLPELIDRALNGQGVIITVLMGLFTDAVANGCGTVVQ